MRFQIALPRKFYSIWTFILREHSQYGTVYRLRQWNARRWRRSSPTWTLKTLLLLIGVILPVGGLPIIGHIQIQIQMWPIFV